MRRAALALACLVSACAMGPNYHRPAIETPPAIRGAADGTTSLSVGDAYWGDLYDDANLKDLLSRALRNNPDVNAAIADAPSRAPGRAFTV